MSSHSGTRLAERCNKWRMLGLQGSTGCKGQQVHSKGPGGMAPPLRTVSLQGSGKCSSEVHCDQAGWTVQHMHTWRTLGLRGSGQHGCSRSACRASVLQGLAPSQAYERTLEFRTVWNIGLAAWLAAQRPACGCTRSWPGLQSGGHSVKQECSAGTTPEAGCHPRASSHLRQHRCPSNLHPPVHADRGCARWPAHRPAPGHDTTLSEHSTLEVPN